MYGREEHEHEARPERHSRQNWHDPMNRRSTRSREPAEPDDEKDSAGDAHGQAGFRWRPTASGGCHSDVSRVLDEDGVRDGNKHLSSVDSVGRTGGKKSLGDRWGAHANEHAQEREASDSGVPAMTLL